ncbi:MAG: type II toxin-antitoxin system RelE/ParE family toxin [Candidatus Sericytochromatia bacterium]|nr:type II toxin-antitoxin system RelE/ParE family toxin [Candidatus Sericytochromatia bacterium]
MPTAQFEKDLRKIGQSNAVEVLRWISKHLEHSEDPRQHGKPLKYALKQYWRYRVGDFCLLTEIQDEHLILTLVTVAHRRHIYRN